jgi:hypothetical protein
MAVWRRCAIAMGLVAAMWCTTRPTRAAAPSQVAADLCATIFSSVFSVPNGEPLAVCQWDMALIKATATDAYPFATGRGVTVGVIDSGVGHASSGYRPRIWIWRAHARSSRRGRRQPIRRRWRTGTARTRRPWRIRRPREFRAGGS